MRECMFGMTFLGIRYYRGLSEIALLFFRGRGDCWKIWQILPELSRKLSHCTVDIWSVPFVFFLHVREFRSFWFKCAFLDSNAGVSTPLPSVGARHARDTSNLCSESVRKSDGWDKMRNKFSYNSPYTAWTTLLANEDKVFFFFLSRTFLPQDLGLGLLYWAVFRQRQRREINGSGASWKISAGKVRQQVHATIASMQSPPFSLQVIIAAGPGRCENAFDKHDRQIQKFDRTICGTQHGTMVMEQGQPTTTPCARISLLAGLAAIRRWLK